MREYAVVWVPATKRADHGGIQWYERKFDGTVPVFVTRLARRARRRAQRLNRFVASSGMFEVWPQGI